MLLWCVAAVYTYIARSMDLEMHEKTNRPTQERKVFDHVPWEDRSNHEECQFSESVFA
jgi:hypothetical protein